MKLSFFKKHRNDVLLISILLIAAVIGWIVLSLNKTEGAYAVVVVDKVETATYPLNVDTEIRLENDGSYNILVIENGSAKIKEASCPDKLCVKQHEIKFNGETLVCLPNKTTVKIVSKQNPDTDFIS